MGRAAAPWRSIQSRRYFAAESRRLRPVQRKSRFSWLSQTPLSRKCPVRSFIRSGDPSGAACSERAEGYLSPYPEATCAAVVAAARLVGDLVEQRVVIVQHGDVVLHAVVARVDTAQEAALKTHRARVVPLDGRFFHVDVARVAQLSRDALRNDAARKHQAARAQRDATEALAVAHFVFAGLQLLHHADTVLLRLVHHHALHAVALARHLDKGCGAEQSELLGVK
mmetsp:Transcript_15757/g.59971  ORF Transcript_15757/g.59971 Transcript_15757/m.59971 type:complete len:225 (-) Transcript_15757:96-770(-)